MKQLDLFAKLDLTEIFEDIVSIWQLKEAFRAVKANKGSPGIDGQTVEEWQTNLEEETKQLSEELKSWKYKPKPVKRIEIPKGDGKGTRKLGIPCVRDRVVQQSIKISTEWKYEEQFSNSSYGFRPRRDQKQAIKKAQEYVKSGRIWIVDIDLEKYFDQIPQDRLMSRLAETIKDKRVLKLIGITLRSGIMLPNGIKQESTEGATQGSPLSPLLSNVVLDELDKELEKRNLLFCRFADDCNIYCRSEKAAQRIMQSVTRFIEKKMKLVVNKEKSKVAKSEKIKFLGVTIVDGIIVIAKKSMKKANEKLKSLIRRRSHKTVEQIINEFNKWYKGWFEYFKITQIPAQLASIEAHARRRIRAKIVVQRKRKRYLLKMLIKKGVKKSTAFKSVYKKGATWAISHSPALEQAFSNNWFRRNGFLVLSDHKLSHWKNLTEWIALT